MATISPAFSSSDTFFSRSRLSLPLAGAESSWRRLQTLSPTCWAGRRSGSVTAWPTIHCASWAQVQPAVADSATSLPWRSTATRCETQHLAELVADEDDGQALRHHLAQGVEQGLALGGVSTAVGSSRIRMRAPRYSA
jgi:hypothetical protein